MRTAFIFCGGGPSRVPLVVPDDALVIAADVGLAEAERLGVEVELLVGDMDSVAAGSLERFEREGGEVRRYPEDKDATDLDLAIEAALVAGVGRVVVVGGGGGRLDHLIANALVMGSPRYAAVEIDGVFGGSRLHVCRGRRQLVGTPGELISLLALGGPARGVRSEGLQWPLEDVVLDPGSSLGVSNLFAEEQAMIEVADGVVLAIRPHGEAAQ
jgi:thiamine pyrophosphokinase